MRALRIPSPVCIRSVTDSVLLTFLQHACVSARVSGRLRPAVLTTIRYATSCSSGAWVHPKPAPPVPGWAARFSTTGNQPAVFPSFIYPTASGVACAKTRSTKVTTCHASGGQTPVSTVFPADLGIVTICTSIEESHSQVPRCLDVISPKMHPP